MKINTAYVNQKIKQELSIKEIHQGNQESTKITQTMEQIHIKTMQEHPEYQGPQLKKEN